ncbi:imelysin family protein [Parvibaculaceae bacterium PLY_AMNH_Bact1]|nr:imelysin family protein [Parvibaculaceae bacterium PLY_AMNH_Bact1]
MPFLKAFKRTLKCTSATLLLSGTLLSPASADAISTDQATALIAALTDQLVVPAYTELAEESSQLVEVLDSYCAAPNTGDRSKVETQFHSTMDAWQRAQIIQFGPIYENKGPARIQFWPDKRGTGQRQLRQVLNNQDETVLPSGALAEKSVALGDLQALEYVLYNDPELTTQPDSFACHYALAIARNQEVHAADIVQMWVGADSYRDQVLNAADGTDVFFDEKEAASRFLNDMAGAIDVIRLQKIDRPMGLTITGARPKRTENWRSGRSLRNIQLNLESVQHFLAVEDGFGDVLSDIGKETTSQAAQQLISEILGHLAAFDQPMSKLVANPDARGDLESLLTKLRSLQSLVREQLAQDLGLVPGFNATDGD